MNEKSKWSYVGVLLAVAVVGLLCAFIVTATVGCKSPSPGLTTNQIIIGPAKYSAVPKLPPAVFNWRGLKAETPQEPRPITVGWEYPADYTQRQAIVFRVYETDTLPLDWRTMRFVEEVEPQTWTTYADRPRAYWTVTASNTLTRQESDPATR